MLFGEQRGKQDKPQVEWENIRDSVHDSLPEVLHLGIFRRDQGQYFIDLSVEIKERLQFGGGEFNEMQFEGFDDVGILEDGFHEEQHLLDHYSLEFIFDQPKELWDGIFSYPTCDWCIDLR